MVKFQIRGPAEQAAEIEIPETGLSFAHGALTITLILIRSIGASFANAMLVESPLLRGSATKSAWSNFFKYDVWAFPIRR